MFTKSLFKQYCEEGTECIDEWRTRFVAIGDPTEYAFGVEKMGSWPQWLKFKRHWKHFRDHILPQWQMELEISVRSAAMSTMVEDSRSSSRSAISSAKWLAEGGFKDKKRGAPSKAEREGRVKIESALEAEIADDMERVLKVVGD
jgi:hypothetical protein